MTTTSIANPSLAELAFLAGDWDMALSNAAFLADGDREVHGRVEVRAIEAGSFLAFRQSAPDSSAATWVIGRDGSVDTYTCLYADRRGVSRVYEMELSGAVWRIWRDDPEFSQRFEASVSDDYNRISGHWEHRHRGGDWEHDFDVTYTLLSPG